MFAAILQSNTLPPQTGPRALSQPQELGQSSSAYSSFATPSIDARDSRPPHLFSTSPHVATAEPAPSITTAFADTDAATYAATALALDVDPTVTDEESVADLPDALAQAQKYKLAAEHLNLLRQGDGAAWDVFVTDWSPRLFSYLRYSLPTREDAEDALSETLVATVEAIKHFDGKSQVSTWLYSIARRKVADFWRKSSNTEELSDLFQAAPNGFSLEFREALAALPEQTRQALLLRYREGFNVSEVSEIMGRTYKATESLLSRGRTLLARQLQPEAE